MPRRQPGSDDSARQANYNAIKTRLGAPGAYAIAIVVVLLALGSPFLRVTWGLLAVVAVVSRRLRRGRNPAAA